MTLANEYTDWSRPSTHPLNVWESLLELLGDALVVAPTVRAGLLHAKAPNSKASTFFYQFQYGVESSPAQKLGCLHGEDLAFVFGAPLVPGHQVGFFSSNYSKSEASLAEIVITFWTNFAKYGFVDPPFCCPASR